MVKSNFLQAREAKQKGKKKMRKQIDDNTKPNLTYARTYPCGSKSMYKAK